MAAPADVGGGLDLLGGGRTSRGKLPKPLDGRDHTSQASTSRGHARTRLYANTQPPKVFRCNFALQLVTYKLAFINVLATTGWGQSKSLRCLNLDFANIRQDAHKT